MTSVLDRPKTEKPAPRETWSGRAWLAVGLVPIAAFASFALGYLLFDLLGYEAGAGTEPLWADLVGAVVTLLVCLPPCVAAVVYGRRARRVGERGGLLPLTIGALAGVGLTTLVVVTTVADAVR
jgi:hypothetical protein